MTRPLHHMRTILLIAALAIPVLSARADDVPDEAGAAKAQKERSLSEAHRRSLARRQAARRRSHSLHQFRSEDGTMMFTNRPEKYRRRSGYEEIRIKYEPINVPRQYRTFKSPSQYTSKNIKELVTRYARRYRLDENLVYAVIRQESNFNPQAVSSAGACGLMQLMPATAAEMGVTSIFDPAQNIAGGTQYLAKMLELFKGNLSLALAAYNAGPENVKKHGGIPPFAETRAYVRAVLNRVKSYGGASVPGALAKLDSHRTFKAVPSSGTQKQAGGRYVVHFHSGLTQPADKVVDKDPYWYIEYGKRVYPVRKELVRRIEEPA